MFTNVNIKLHFYQKELIKKLVTRPTLRFNELLIEELESEHMNYHLKQLINIGFVEKKKGKYNLTKDNLCESCFYTLCNKCYL